MTSADQRPNPAPFSTLICMIVEDEPFIAVAMEEAFIDAGHDVVGPFGSCASAEAWLAVNSPSVAVVDAFLRDGPCLNLIRMLRDKQVPVVVFSGDFLALEPADNVVLMMKPAPFDTVVEAATRLARGNGAARANSKQDA